MASLKIRHFVERPGARGKGPRYHWQPSRALRAAGWPHRRLADDKGQAIAEAEAINAELDAWRLGEARGPDALETVRPGTVDALIRDYRASRYFPENHKSRAAYDGMLRLISAWSGAAPVAVISPKKVAEFYEAMYRRTPAQANLCISVLRSALKAARLVYEPHEPGYVEHNPASRIGTKGTRRGGFLWPRAAVAAIVETADALGWPSIGDAVTINEWLGQREGDLLALPRSTYRSGALYVHQSKRGARVVLPIDMVPALAARLEQAAARQKKARVTATTLIVCDSTGRAWRQDNFRDRLREIRTALAKTAPSFQADPDYIYAGAVAVDNLKFKYLRHTAVTRLAEAGVNAERIAAITGHSLATVYSIIDRYMVRTAAMARDAFQMRLEAEANGDTQE